MDQTSQLTNQIANNEDSNTDYQSDSGHTLLHERSSPSNYSTSIISRRSPLPLSGATRGISNRGIAETSNLSSADTTEHIRNTDSGASGVPNPRNYTTLSLNPVLDCHFPPPRMTYALQYILQRPLLPASRFIAWNGSSAHQVHSQPPASSDEIWSQDETDHIRRQYEESILCMLRVPDDSLEGSMALTILPAGNGVNLRLVSEEQDIPFLIQSLFSFITDMIDRYRDMRIDVDRMSYEELLALEDHIGNVDTGLSEETMTKSLKHCKYFLLTEENAEKDSCSVCQEDYEEEDDLGILNCGHRFHMECIKRWLRCKNLCPVCKSTALCTTDHTLPQICSL
ncbi:E3 ubiquitin-protein ligase MBR2-like [Cornus florida]|uniref:E3 ubiquitin-protein ligase MBR2-like n=1 Tax=Cornus florida TaxID=4283 RepID=UPI002899B34A|nr:E3 ubiquitin-protein ligase MBR2-like [Cornus florida]